METLPLASVALQVTSVNPIVKSAGALFSTFTVNISVAVAVPIAIGVLNPVASYLVILAGSISTGCVLSFIVTYCSAVTLFPFSSIAVKVTF